MFDKLVREIEHQHYIKSGIEKGWFPENIVKLVMDSVKKSVENPDTQQLEESVSTSLVAVRNGLSSSLPENYCLPLDEAEQVALQTKIDASIIRRILPSFISRHIAIYNIEKQSQNPYERLWLQMQHANTSSERWSYQDSIIDEALPISAIESLRGNFDQAITLLEDLVDNHYVGWESRKNVVVNRIGYIYLLKGDFVRAECTFKEVQRRGVIYLEGGEGAILYNHQLALVYLINGEPTKAEKAFERVSMWLPSGKSEEYKKDYQILVEQHKKQLPQGR